MRGVPRQQHRDMQFQQHFSRLGVVHLHPNEVEDPKSFSIENAYLSGFWSGSVLRFDPGLKPRRCGFDPGFDRGKHEPEGPLTRKGVESTSRFGTQGRRYEPRSISFEADIDGRPLDFDGRCSRDRSHRGVSFCTPSSPRGREDGGLPPRVTVAHAPFLRRTSQSDLRNRRWVDEAFADTSVRPGISIRDSPPPPVSVSSSVFETEMGDSRRRPHPLARRTSIRHRREVQAVRAREGRL